MGGFPSGQWAQTVNLLLNASVVRIHQLPPKRTRNLGCGFFFVLELVGFEQVGRPQTAKNSPADCFLDRGLRIHQLPPKSCGKDIAAAFFSFLYRIKSAKAMTDFQSAFYRDVQLLPGGWIFSGCRKTLVGASIARPRPFALQETIPENALLR